jgi:diguanylate cyclase (GGDEF)-like protein
MQAATVLIISDQLLDPLPLRAALEGERRAGMDAFRLYEPKLGALDGLKRLAEGGVDAILVDATGAPDAVLDTIIRARVEAPHIPVVLLTSAEPGGHAALEAQAIEAGAQDTIAREHLGGGMLARVLHYAVERQRLQETLRRLALSDPLTGLYTRRGFVALLEHHVKLARRTRGLLLVGAAVDDLPAPTTREERDARDRALIGAAQVLQITVRASDVVARLDDDTFAILVLDASGSAMDPISARLQMNLDRHNAEHAGAGHPLSISLALARLDPRNSMSADEMLDSAMAALAERPWAG